MASGATLWSRDYGYDANGNRKRVEFGDATEEVYAYDPLNRLKRVDYPDTSVQEFSYDQVGNRTHVVDRGLHHWYHYLANSNRIQKVTSDPAGQNILQTLLYDDNGNPTRKDDLSAGTWQTYDYDAAGRLLLVENHAGDSWEYAYDALGQRVHQTAPSKSRDYIWSQGNRVGEYEASSGTRLARFTYGPRLDDLIQVERGGTLGHVHSDALGSVLAISEPAGAQLASYAYDVYGELQSQAGAFENDFGFTGRELDSNGLLYYRARFYDPTLGRFMNEDPIGFDGGINLYAYTANNPTTLVDPTGNFPAALLIGGLIGGVADGVSEYRSQTRGGGDVNWVDVATASAVGAAFGAVNPFGKVRQARAAMKLLAPALLETGEFLGTRGAAELAWKVAGQKSASILGRFANATVNAAGDAVLKKITLAEIYDLSLDGSELATSALVSAVTGAPFRLISSLDESIAADLFAQTILKILSKTWSKGVGELIAEPQIGQVIKP